MDVKQSLSFLLLLVVGLMLSIAALAYRMRHLPVAKTMMLTILAAAFYTLGYAFEVASTDLWQFKLSLHIEYLGIPFVATLWLYQAIQFTGTAPAIRKRLAVWLFVIPVSVFLMHLTNDWHGLVYESYEFNSADAIPLYTTVKGPWYSVHAIYNYGVLLFGLALFIRMYLYSYPIVRKQILVLILGAAAPMLCNFLFWFGITIDMTPFGFAVSGMVYIWGVWRFNLLRLGPLAMEKVFGTIRDGVVLLDYDDQIIGYNGAAGAVFPELTIRKRYPLPAAEILTGNPALLAHIGSAAGDNNRFPFRLQHEGRSKHYICSVTPIIDGDSSHHIGKIMMINDITELKENEARLEEYARQLTELNAFKDKLFTIVAHDIRDPIVMLVSLTELLGEELAAAGMERAELFREIEGQMNSTYRLVDNLLDWYRSQQGKVAFRPSVWNVRQVVLQSLSVAGIKARMKRIQLKESVEEELAVLADKEMLDLILRNLLSNAIKYTGMDGTVEVGAQYEGEAAMIFVRDNGAGIDEQTAEMLLREEPFFYKGDAGGDAGDTRFGLVLAREFVRINGGRLWFESKQGEGATFWFTLPMASNEKSIRSISNKGGQGS